MTIEDRLRRAMTDADWSLPTWQQPDTQLRRAARRQHRVAAVSALTAVVIAATAAIAVPLALAGGGSTAVSPAKVNKQHTGHSVTTTITIDADSHETFAAPPSYMHAKLTARQAFDASAKRREPIPSQLSYQLGILTSPPSVTDVLVWGFHGQPGLCATHSVPTRAVNATPRPNPSPAPQCIVWDFVSATTGRGVEGTEQQIGIPTPAPSPTPPAVMALRSGGFLDAEPQRFSPQDLVLQGPESTIRWTFNNANCTIALHWFLPPATQSSPARAACPWDHTFATSITTNFTSRGHVFSVVAGYVPEREHYLVKATLADGDTQIYDASDADGVWMFAVQRCGNVAGTAITSVTELIYRHGVPQASTHTDRYPQSIPTTLAQHCQAG